MVVSIVWRHLNTAISVKNHWNWTHLRPRGDPDSTFGGGAISVIFDSQLSSWVPYYEIYFTTLLRRNNGRQNGLISRMLFSELYKIMVKKVTLVGFRGAIVPIAHLENPVEHSWKLLDIVWKIWAPLRKLFVTPGVPS